MQLQIEQRPKFCLIRFPRPTELTSRTSEEFYRQVRESCAFDRPLLLDGTRLDFIDSTGISALIRLHKRLRGEGHGLVLAGLNPTIEEIMHVSRLHRLFDIVGDTQAAISMLEHKPANRPVRTSFAVEFEVQRRPQVAVLKIVSPDVLVEANSTQFLDEFNRQTRGAPRIILDLDRLRNIDSLGVAALIHLQSKARKSGRPLVFVCSTPTLIRLLRLYHIDTVLQWEKSLSAALARLGVGPPAGHRHGVAADDDYVDLHFLKTGKDSHA